MAYPNTSFGFNYMLTPMVKRLLIANTVVFMVSLVVPQAILFDWFAFQPTNIFLRPWGPFTYMFLHAGLFHLASNMIVLFFFGPPLESRWGESEFLRFYLICGLGGAAMSYLFVPNWVVGASAATYGVMLAFAMNWPDVPIYIWGIFPVQAKYLVMFATIVSLLAAVDGVEGGRVAHFAHLGGFLAGFLYLKADWRPSKAFLDVKKAATKRRMAIVPGGDGSDEIEARRGDVVEEAALYDKVDEVLDKISATGMSSLTEEELKLLDDVSKKHRTN